MLISHILASFQILTRVKMRTLISLCLSLLLAAVSVHGDLSWITEEERVTLGPEIQSHQLHCKVSMPAGTSPFDVLPNWYKSQRIEFIDDKRAK